MYQTGETTSAADFLHINTAALDRTVRLELCGDLDSQTAPLLTAAFAGAIAPVTERVELHLAKLTFLDAAGVRCLLRCLNAGVDLVLVEPSTAVTRVLEALRLSSAFGISSTDRQLQRHR